MLLTCALIAITTSVIGIGTALYFKKKDLNYERFIPALFAGLFIASVAVEYPVMLGRIEGDASSVQKGVEALVASLHTSLMVFTLNAEIADVVEVVNSHYGVSEIIYIAVAFIVYLAAGVSTFAVVLNFFGSIANKIKLMLNKNKKAYVFSNINEKSVTLAESMYEHDCKGNTEALQIIFANYEGESEVVTSSLLDRITRIHGILVKGDMNSIRVRDNVKLRFFVITDDESSCLEQSVAVIENYKNRPLTKIRIFSESLEAKALANVTRDTDSGSVPLEARCISPSKSLVYRHLFSGDDLEFKGFDLFDNAIDRGDYKEINAVVVGLDNYGMNMFKSLIWYLVMVGYKANIYAYSEDAEAGSRFDLMCPEIKKFNGEQNHEPGNGSYNVRVFSGVNFESNEFYDSITRNVPEATFVFVSTGNDGLNTQLAIRLRERFTRIKLSGEFDVKNINENKLRPQIVAIHSIKKVGKAVGDMDNNKKQKYRLQFIGGLEDVFSYETVINPKAKAMCIKKYDLDTKKGNDRKREFYLYEYNQDSSIANKIHKRAKRHVGVKGADVPYSAFDFSNEDNWASYIKEYEQIIICEHERWDAYTRVFGYVYGPVRCDLAKVHHCLKNYVELDDENKIKDLENSVMCEEDF